MQKNLIGGPLLCGLPPAKSSGSCITQASPNLAWLSVRAVSWFLCLSHGPHSSALLSSSCLSVCLPVCVSICLSLTHHHTPQNSLCLCLSLSFTHTHTSELTLTHRDTHIAWVPCKLGHPLSVHGAAPPCLSLHHPVLTVWYRDSRPLLHPVLTHCLVQGPPLRHPVLTDWYKASRPLLHHPVLTVWYRGSSPPPTVCGTGTTAPYVIACMVQPLLVPLTPSPCTHCLLQELQAPQPITLYSLFCAGAPGPPFCDTDTIAQLLQFEPHHLLVAMHCFFCMLLLHNVT